MKVNILGSEWEIFTKKESEDEMLKSYDGITDWSIRTILLSEVNEEPFSLKNLEQYKNQTLRHELIHAFLQESGLLANTSKDWARSEEMVDWFAYNFHKIYVAMKQTYCFREE